MDHHCRYSLKKPVCFVPLRIPGITAHLHVCVCVVIVAVGVEEVWVEEVWVEEVWVEEVWVEDRARQVDMQRRRERIKGMQVEPWQTSR